MSGTPKMAPVLGAGRKPAQPKHPDPAIPDPFKDKVPSPKPAAEPLIPEPSGNSGAFDLDSLGGYGPTAEVGRGDKFVAVELQLAMSLLNLRPRRSGFHPNFAYPKPDPSVGGTHLVDVTALANTYGGENESGGFDLDDTSPTDTKVPRPPLEPTVPARPGIVRPPEDVRAPLPGRPVGGGYGIAGDQVPEDVVFPPGYKPLVTQQLVQESTWDWTDRLGAAVAVAGAVLGMAWVIGNDLHPAGCGDDFMFSIYWEQMFQSARLVFN